MLRAFLVDSSDSADRARIAACAGNTLREPPAIEEMDAIVSDETPEVIMYCRSWCGDCARARRWLDDHDIPYTEIDVEANPGARERAAAHNAGDLHTPTFEIGDGVCVDFRPDRLSELLGLE